MSEPEKPKARAKAIDPLLAKSAEVLPFKHAFPLAVQPDRLNSADALKVIRAIAADTNKIVVVGHGQERARQRRITRPQVERCVQKGTITEGPFVNIQGSWQVNLTRHTAGESITCVVAIEWATAVVVITTF